MSTEEVPKGDQGFITDDRVLCCLPKNNATEHRVMTKSAKNRHTKKSEKFIDIREHWYRDGHLEEPIPTRKGTMVRRDQIGKMVAALLMEMKPGEVEGEDLVVIQRHTKRLSEDG